jgi:carboxypeptidase D
MRRIALLAVAVVFLVAPDAHAAGRGEPGPVFAARVVLTDELAQLELLHDLDIDVDGVFDGWARAFLIQEELEKLQLLGFGVSIIPDEVLLPGRFETAGVDVPSQYHTYTTLTADLQQIAADHPAITRLISVGQSEQGRELWVMKITDNPDAADDEPEVAYISSMHGDEVVGKELCFNLIDYLTDNYGTDQRVTDLVDGTEIWILPSMNPDGTEAGWRYNANFVDLNRDFPDQFNDPVNTPAGRAAETAAVMSWYAGRNFSLSLNYHGGALVANYPFDSNSGGSSIYSPSPDDDVFLSISRTYADNNPPMSTSNGHSSFNDGVCNGADWYAINGGLQDWGYVWYGDFDVTLEVSNTKWPSGNTLPGFWNDNLESMLAYMERVHEGIRGVVTDAQTGQPLVASVALSGSAFPTRSDPALGNFHRLVLPGTYDVEVSATGYASEVFQIQVPAGAALRRDVALTPLAANLRPLEGCADNGPGCDPWLVPGQTTDLAVTLRNLGVAATQIGGDLVPTGWHADVTRAGATYPDLVAGASGSSDAPHHEVTVSAAAPAGHKLGFALDWSAGEGSGLSEPFFVPVDAATCSTVGASDVPATILDRQTTTSQVDVLTDRELSSVTVWVDIDHTYRSDLRVDLVSPGGTVVTLHDRSGGSADDILGTYGVDLTPFESLSRLDGESSLGTWELRVNDGVPGNGGLLNDWSLETCGRPFESAPPEMRLRAVSAEPGGVTLDWWVYPGLTSYRVYRSSDPSSAAAFVDVTGEDPDDSDTAFKDTTTDPVSFWLVTGVGPSGEGPKGHFGQ